uniref:Uncharacterized protein n=1 Tax=Gopherus evgoodei TaxID=1825980 RepID=A0A8C4WLM4_9SAUR
AVYPSSALPLLLLRRSLEQPSLEERARAERGARERGTSAEGEEAALWQERCGRLEHLGRRAWTGASPASLTASLRGGQGALSPDHAPPPAQAGPRWTFSITGAPPPHPLLRHLRPLPSSSLRRLLPPPRGPARVMGCIGSRTVGNEVIAVDWKGLKDVDQINMDSTSSLHGSSIHRPSTEVSAHP